MLRCVHACMQLHVCIYVCSAYFYMRACSVHVLMQFHTFFIAQQHLFFRAQKTLLTYVASPIQYTAAPVFSPRLLDFRSALRPHAYATVPVGCIFFVALFCITQQALVLNPLYPRTCVNNPYAPNRYFLSIF